MNFYIVLLKGGNVVGINKYDDEDVQLEHFRRFTDEVVGAEYDDVQIFNEVK